MHSTNPHLDPGPILQTAFAFWSSKVLLTAVEFGVFTKLGKRRITGAELGAELDLHPRSISDFFDALVAMKFLDRESDGPSAKYFNTLVIMAFVGMLNGTGTDRSVASPTIRAAASFLPV